MICNTIRGVNVLVTPPIWERKIFFNTMLMVSGALKSWGGLLPLLILVNGFFKQRPVRPYYFGSWQKGGPSQNFKDVKAVVQKSLGFHIESGLICYEICSAADALREEDSHIFGCNFKIWNIFGLSKFNLNNVNTELKDIENFVFDMHVFFMTFWISPLVLHLEHRS